MNQVAMSELVIRGAVSSALDDYQMGTSRELALENAILGCMAEDDPRAEEVVRRFDAAVTEYDDYVPEPDASHEPGYYEED